MSVRKRKWITSRGEAREAFIVDYVDQQGERHIRTFDRRGDATAYEATVKVGIAAVKGTYKGTLTITDKREPTHYKIILEGSGGSGFMRGEGTIDLEADGDATRVKWTGDMQIGGLIAGVGQRMLGGVGKMLIGQFFKCLEQRLGPGA